MLTKERFPGPGGTSIYALDMISQGGRVAADDLVQHQSR
jgi:hypothetical protein